MSPSFLLDCCGTYPYNRCFQELKMNKFLVLGAGRMGVVLAKDLVESDPENMVTLVDIDARSLQSARKFIPSERLFLLQKNVEDESQRNEVFARHDVALNALLHKHSLMMLEAAVEFGIHYVDLVGENTLGRLPYDSDAKKKGLTVLSGMGLSPGITNVCVARATELLDTAEKAFIYVGGNPVHASPPLNYRLIYAVESLLNFYQRPVIIIKEGKEKEVIPLSGVEDISFPPDFPEMECFYTDGLNSLLYTMKGKITDELAEKTVRHKGHAEQVKILQACGLFSTEPIQVKGQKIVPRDVLEELLNFRLRMGKERDVTLMRIVVSGKKAGKHGIHEFEMVDYADSEKGYSSMAKTTSFPASIAAQLIVKGKITQRGVLFPENIFTRKLYPELIESLRKRGVIITHKSIS